MSNTAHVWCRYGCHYVGTCNGDSTCRDEFWTDPMANQYYRDHVATLLNRRNTINGRLYRFFRAPASPQLSAANFGVLLMVVSVQVLAMAKV